MPDAARILSDYLRRPIAVDAPTHRAIGRIAARVASGEDVDPAELIDLVPVRAQTNHGGTWPDHCLYEVVGSVAVVPIDGVIWYTRTMFDWFMSDTSTQMVCTALLLAAADDTIDTVLLDMHTPGGSVDGMSDLLAAVDNFKATGKRLCAIAHDMCCSMGMALAAGAHELVATSSATIGSVGMLAMYYDDAEAFKAGGVRPVPIATGSHKAVGYPGVAIDDDGIADVRRMIDVAYAEFVRVVAEGRNLDPQAIRDMQAAVYCATDAVANGLADRVVGFDDYLRELVDRESATGTRQSAPQGRHQAGPQATQTQTQEPTTMTLEEFKTENPDAFEELMQEARDQIEQEKETTDEPAAQEPPPEEEPAKDPEKDPEEEPATIGQLDKAVPEATRGRDAFIAGCMRDGLTLGAAKDRLIGHMAKATGVRSGRAPVSGAGGGGDTYASYDDAAKAIAKRDNIPLVAARAKVNKEFPELREQYVAQLSKAG